MFRCKFKFKIFFYLEKKKKQNEQKKLKLAQKQKYKTKMKSRYDKSAFLIIIKFLISISLIEIECSPCKLDLSKYSFLNGLTANKPWLITGSSSNRQALYEISLCNSSSLCETTSLDQSDSISVCKLTNQLNSQNKSESKSEIIGYGSKIELETTADGYVLKSIGAKCKTVNNTVYNHTTYVYFHCGKTIGVPSLVYDYKYDTSDDGSSSNECKTIFDWESNQVCTDSRFRAAKEIPCYLTLNDGSFDYKTVDFSPLVLVNSSTSSSYANFHQVVEFNPEFDVSLNLCRYYGNSSK